MKLPILLQMQWLIDKHVAIAKIGLNHSQVGLGEVIDITAQMFDALKTSFTS